MDKIVCVGKNYLEHTQELGDAIPDKPVIFLKPPSVLKEVSQRGLLNATLPKNSGLVHHECEIVIKLRGDGYQLTLAEAEELLGWVTVGLDMTLRDKQSVLKKSGGPWTIAKVFPDSAIIGHWIPIEQFPHYLNTPFSISVNGQVRQSGIGKQMGFSPAACVAYISEHFPLCKGDLIFTGTPKGVDAIQSGDKATLEFGEINYNVQWNG